MTATATRAIRAATACLALLLAPLSGCIAPAPLTHLHIDFGGARPAADAEVAMPGCGADPPSPTSTASPASAPSPASSPPSAASAAPPCTAQAQILLWSERGGLPLEIEHFSFGDCLARIAGLPAASGCQPGATAYWSLSVDGVEASTGMGQAVLQEGDRVAWTLTPLAPAPPPAGTASPLALSLDAPAGPTRNATLAVSGTVSRAARISLTVAHGNATTALPGLDAVAGLWTAEVPLPAGNSTLRVLADDGAATAAAEARLVRHAHGRMQVAFRGLPGHADRTDEVWFDPDGRPSAPFYAGQAVPHPDHANVHDLMAAWTAQTGVPVVYKPHASFGQQVMQIDGVGDPTVTSGAFWCYQYNGATAGLGITEQEFKDGDVVAWSLGTVC